MKDDNGRVLIKGFYDDVTPLTESEKIALKNIPPVEDQMREELGFLKWEGGGQSLAELISQPSLNVSGLLSANVGKMAANVIPTSATAALDLCLVLGNDAQRQVQKWLNTSVLRGIMCLKMRALPMKNVWNIRSLPVYLRRKVITHNAPYRFTNCSKRH